MSDVEKTENTEAAPAAAAKPFTQEQIDEIVKERLDRERKKYKALDEFGGLDSVIDSAKRLKEIEAAQKTELQKANDNIEAYRKKIAELESVIKRNELETRKSGIVQKLMEEHKVQKLPEAYLKAIETKEDEAEQSAEAVRWIEDYKKNFNVTGQTAAAPPAQTQSAPPISAMDKFKSMTREQLLRGE